MSDSNSARWDKARWRTELQAARAAVDERTRTAEAAALAAAVPRVLDTVAGDSNLVAAYVPVGSEPGALSMVNALVEAGARVLLPVTGGLEPLRWAEYTGEQGLRRARFGLLEPDGPQVPAEELAGAAAMLIPALAVDRQGVRLGRGAGHYDRSLHVVGTGVPLIAVVRDTEVVARLPEEAHDRRMGWALTPGLGPIRLGTA